MQSVVRGGDFGYAVIEIALVDVFSSDSESQYHKRGRLQSKKEGRQK